MASFTVGSPPPPFQTPTPSYGCTPYLSTRGKRMYLSHACPPWRDFWTGDPCLSGTPTSPPSNMAQAPTTSLPSTLVPAAPPVPGYYAWSRPVSQQWPPPSPDPSQAQTGMGISNFRTQDSASSLGAPCLGNIFVNAAPSPWYPPPMMLLPLLMPGSAPMWYIPYLSLSAPAVASTCAGPVVPPPVYDSVSFCDFQASWASRLTWSLDPGLDRPIWATADGAWRTPEAISGIGSSIATWSAPPSHLRTSLQDSHALAAYFGVDRRALAPCQALALRRTQNIRPGGYVI